MQTPQHQYQQHDNQQHYHQQYYHANEGVPAYQYASSPNSAASHLNVAAQSLTSLEPLWSEAPRKVLDASGNKILEVGGFPLHWTGVLEEL